MQALVQDVAQAMAALQPQVIGFCLLVTEPVDPSPDPDLTLPYMSTRSCIGVASVPDCTSAY